MTAPDRLCWLDLETSGLDPTRHLILEFAAVVTDADLVELASVQAVVGWPVPILRESADPTADRMHEASGLWAEVAASDLSSPEAEHQLAELVAEHAPGAPLAGSGVHFDRAFLAVRMPSVLDLVHYRNVDVSTIRTLTRMWAPDLAAEVESPHRAMPDVLAAVAELRRYRTALWGQT